MTDEPILAGDDGAGNPAAAPAVDTKPATPTPAAPDPAKKEAAPEPKPLALSDGSEDDKKPVDPKWREDWRRALAGEDKADLKTLDRFSSPEDIWKALKNLRQKASEKQVTKPPGADAAPEVIAAYRKENGIPEKPEEYKFDLGGIIPSESDKPVLEAFKTFAHQNNVPADEAGKYVGWFFEQQEKATVAQQKADEEFRIASSVELREEWGSDYRPNLNALKNFFAATAPEGLLNRVLGARLGDGKVLGDDPEALRWLVSVAREQAPGASLLPAGTPNIGKGVDDRIAEIEKVMSENRSAYFKDAKMQDEYRELLEARTKMNQRAA